jgi:flavin-dependent dehydrogenase
MPDFDVIVIGGGPGGSLTASLVRRQDPGRQVLVLEREKFPRHHVGESTLPSWQPILERAGVLPRLKEAISVRRLGGRFLWGRAKDQACTLDFRNPDGSARDASYHVDRAAFDQLLLEHASSLGAEVRERATVTSVARHRDGVTEVDWQEGGCAKKATAHYVVDASGQARVLARLLGLPLVPYEDMNDYAIWAYWRGSKIEQQGGSGSDGERWTLVSTCDDGWAWHIPIDQDCVSVGVVNEARSLPGAETGALEDFYLRNVRRCPEVGELLRGAEIVQHPLAGSKLLTTRDWSSRCTPVCGDGWFLVGDAALFVDPILSTGLLIAANGASMAANALHTLWNDPEVDTRALLDSYDATYREAGTSFHRLARVWYSRNFKRSTWHGEAKRQRLRTGHDPWQESSAEAFFRQCIGSFADPVEGALPATTSHDTTRASDARWSELLPSRVRVRGCTWRRAESYFTDRTIDHWVRVAYVEVRPEGTNEPFDRVVFPSSGDMPESILPLLDGSAPLADVLRSASRGLRGTERTVRLAALRQQVLQLDHCGYLERTADAQPSAVGELPLPIASALANALARGGERWLVHIDLPGETLGLHLDGHSDVAVLLAAQTPSKGAFLRTATTRLWYSGTTVTRPAERLLRDLAARLRVWEARQPDAAATFWERDFAVLARRP